MVCPPEEGSLKDAIYEGYIIIISNYSQRNIIPPQINKMFAHYKVMCGSEYVYLPIVCILTCYNAEIVILKK